MGSQRIAEFIAGTDYGGIPREAVSIARQGILDYLGVAIAGSSEPVAGIISQQVRQTRAAREAGVIAGKFRTSADLAAWANGTIGHAIDYDDIFSTAAGYNMHPSVPVLPAVFALGEKHRVTGKDILAAYIIGIEVESRIGAAIGFKNFEAGWHPMAVLGTIAAAAAGARILRLGAREAQMALAIASSLAGGVMGNIGTMTKPMHAGNAARNGVVAAELAARGFTGNGDVLEGEGSFCRAFSGGNVTGLADRDADLGKKWHIVSIGLGFKPYPSCRGTHSSIDAALQIRKQADIQADQIAAITCNTNARLSRTLKFPLPRTGYEGKFSIQYCVATALLRGKVVLDDFTDERVNAPVVQGLLPRISMVHPKDWGGESHLTQEVIVRLKNGKEYSYLASAPRGEPKNPMGESECLAKFRDCTAGKLKPADIERALELVQHVEELGDIAELADMVTNLRTGRRGGVARRAFLSPGPSRNPRPGP